MSVHGPHGQHIENIHLEKYATEEEFWEKLYYAKYSKLFDKAKAFSHGADPENVLVFIRSGQVSDAIYVRSLILHYPAADLMLPNTSIHLCRGITGGFLPASIIASL